MGADSAEDCGRYKCKGRRLDLRSSRGRTRFGALLVLSQAPSEDWRTNAFLADQVVVVAGIVDRHDVAVDETDDGMTIGTTSPQVEAASNDRQGDLRAIDVLVFDFVGIELGPRVEPVGPRRNASTRLQGCGVHTDDQMAAPIGNVVRGRASANPE